MSEESLPLDHSCWGLRFSDLAQRSFPPSVFVFQITELLGISIN